MLTNLLANALAYTEPGGDVTLSVASTTDRMTFAVRDTGAGIPAEEIPHIFERHWRSHASARKGGSGLGLAIARGIVEAHGGSIRVESVPGRGSTFFVVIPAVARDA